MNIVKQITDEMQKYGVIQEKEYNIYCYGVELVLLKCCAGMIALFVSWILHTTVFLLSLFLFLIPIRRFAGGVHARSRGTCMFLTELILLLAELVWKYDLWPEIIQPYAMGFGLAAIMQLAPLESEKRRLSDKKRKRFRRMAILFGFVNLGCYLIAGYGDFWVLRTSASIAMFIEAMLLIVAIPAKIKKDTTNSS